MMASRKKFGLWRKSMTVEELAEDLAADVIRMKRHVYTASRIWESCSQDLQRLRPGLDVVTIEDFQKNLEICHAEIPTSMGFSANSIAIAMYPVAVKFRRILQNQESKFESAWVIFVSPDLRHDNQQIAVMERRRRRVILVCDRHQ